MTKDDTSSILTIQAQEQPVQFFPCDLIVCASGPREIVRFLPDGTIKMGDGYTPTEAGAAFIEVLRSSLPSQAENDMLKARIAQLEATLARTNAALGSLATAADKRVAELEVEWESALDALAHAALVECERAIKQREESLRTGKRTAAGGTHETCFKHAFKQVLEGLR